MFFFSDSSHQTRKAFVTEWAIASALGIALAFTGIISRKRQTEASFFLSQGLSWSLVTGPALFYSLIYLSV
jgi:hypothetical protein